MVALGSGEWANPRKCPASCVVMESRSSVPGGTTSSAVSGAVPLISMSAS
jgi:hypothetical protein